MLHLIKLEKEKLNMMIYGNKGKYVSLLLLLKAEFYLELVLQRLLPSLPDPYTDDLFF